MVKFGIHTYGRFAINYFARNADNILVGWRFGAHSLGFYKKAYDLFAMSANQLTAPLTNVAVSALSRYEARSPAYKENLIGALSTMAFVGMGLSAVLTLIGRDLILLLLGPAWEPAGRIFTFFGPGIGAMLIYCMHGWVHLSIGTADRWFRWGIAEVAVTFALFFVALPWGPVGIATAWTASFWILLLPAFWYAGKPIGLRPARVFGAVWRHVVASLLAAGSTIGVLRAGGLGIALAPSPLGPFARILVTSVLYGVLYLGAVILTHAGLTPIQQAIRLFREMLPSGRRSVKTPAGPAPRENVPAGRQGGKLVSILIPAYNAEEFLADTLRSAIAQTWEPKEIIVVDDGSTDQTAAIARQFTSQGVRVVTQKNQGAAAARNTAYSLSQGDYIQWLDADDLLAPDKIARQMEFAEQCQNRRLLLSGPFARFRYRYYAAEFCPTALWCDLSPVEWLQRKLGQNVYMQTATWLTSRELAEAAGPWDTSLLGDDDGEYFCRVLLASDGTRFVPGAKVYYRSPWAGSLSQLGRSDRRIEAHWTSMKLHIRYIRSLEDNARTREACLRYLQTCLIYFYPENPEIVKQSGQLARDLGGELNPPRLIWKYSWIRATFGWELAKRAGSVLQLLRWTVEKSWDKLRFRIDEAFGLTQQ
jgi:glycosyltransferase involved in cell wall biosynthesis